MIKYIILSIFFVGFLSCSQKSTSEDPIVAKIGDEVITASQFKLNYEFGLAHLKKGANPKRTYLDFMIKERVLSQQGYNLGLDKADAVTNAVKRFEDELLIEELFIDQVHNKINVTDEEINEALNKSKVSWKFRYWVEPTYAGANIVASAMRQRGYAEVVGEFLNRNPETPLAPSNFESDFVSWLDVPPELLEAIQNLPRGDISGPIELNGVYYIIQITDIRQQGVLESEYADKASSLKTILFYRKVMEQGFKYVSEFLTPKEIVTKGDQFRLLAAALAEWKKMENNVPFVESVENATEEQQALFALKNNFTQPLVSFKGGNWSLEEFAKKFDTEELTENPDDRMAFQNQLNNKIGLSIRNHFLLDEARKRKLNESENLRVQLASWQDKWVYQEARFNYTKDLKVSNDQFKEFFENNKQKYTIRKDKEPTYNEFRDQVKQDTYLDHARKILYTKVDSLAQYIPIQIYDSVLDTITVVESKKSKWMSIQLFKRSSNRLLYPIVDPAWGF